MDEKILFEYQRGHFICSAIEQGNSLFQPYVLYQFGIPGYDEARLVLDTEPYATAAEALRHAQQQAIRWVHDQTGDGQGQF